MMTIKEYAESQRITYEAVRISIKKHPEINKHIKKVGRTRYIDDEGIEMLDNLRNKIISSGSDRHQTKRNERDYISILQNEIIELQKKLLEASENEHKALLEVAELKQLSITAKRQESEIEALQTELNRYKKTVFGLYVKKDK